MNVVTNVSVVVCRELPYDVSIESHKIEAMRQMVGIYSPSKTKEEIDFLRSIRIGGKKVSMRSIAKRIGVNRENLYHWINGTYIPRNPLPLMVLHLWVELVKQELTERETRRVPFQPVTSAS